MLESEYAYIKDETDWAHYCALLDNMGQPIRMRDINKPRTPYFFDHIGSPSSYPCLVQSEFGDDPNGPYYECHHFVYLEDAAKLLHASLEDLVAERDYYKEQYENLKKVETT